MFKKKKEWIPFEGFIRHEFNDCVILGVPNEDTVEIHLKPHEVKQKKDQIFIRQDSRPMIFEGMHCKG